MIIFALRKLWIKDEHNIYLIHDPDHDFKYLTNHYCYGTKPERWRPFRNLRRNLCGAVRRSAYQWFHGKSNMVVRRRYCIFNSVKRSSYRKPNNCTNCSGSYWNSGTANCTRHQQPSYVARHAGTIQLVKIIYLIPKEMQLFCISFILSAAFPGYAEPANRRKECGAVAVFGLYNIYQ